MTDDTQQQRVEMSGWGKRFGFTGPNAFPWFVILMLLTGMGYLVFFSLGGWGKPMDIGRALTESSQKTTQMIEEHTTAMRADHKLYMEAVVENTYTLSACLKPRPGVECPNMMMPDSLRRKLKRE